MANAVHPVASLLFCGPAAGMLLFITSSDIIPIVKNVTIGISDNSPDDCRMKRFIPYILLVILSVQSCRSVKSKAPAEAYQSFEYKAPVSHVVVPVELSLREIEAELNAQLNGLIYDDADFSDGVLMKVWKVSPILLSMRGEDIVYEVPIKIWSKLKWEFNQFGFTVSDEFTADASLRMTFNTKLKIGVFWTLEPQTTLQKYDWIEKPVITGGSISLPVTFIADRIIKSQQKVITEAIDTEIKKQIELRKYVEEGWNALHQPIQLYNNPTAWLRISPSGIVVTPLTGNKDFATATIRIDGIAETFVGAKPAVKLSNLPNATFANNASGDFVISLINEMSYAEASKLAHQHLSGQTFTSANGKKKIRIDSVQIYGGGDHLIIKTHVSGNVTGNIYLRGKPTYDSIAQVIYLRNVDYSIETKNAMVKTGNWILKSTLTKRMQEALRYSVAADLAEMKKQANAYISSYKISKNVEVKATVDQLEPKEFFITEESIKAVIYATGSMKLSVKGLDIP